MPTLTKQAYVSNGSVKKGLARLKTVKQPAKPAGPLWLGPMNEGPLGGITQSVIASWFVDKERCRLRMIEGLKEEDKFNHRLEYGHMFHLCEEHLAAGKPYEQALLNYAKGLVAKYGNAASGEINKWYSVCAVQFPHYVNFWRKNKDVKKRIPVEQEQVFHVPYKLPSGRTVWLRGKRDNVDIIDKQVFIGEHKTKSEVDPEQLLQLLRLDLQSNFYMTSALIDPVLKAKIKNLPIVGVRYNTVIRPLSGGKHSISQRKGMGKAKKGAETEEQFYARLGELIRDNGDFFFKKWNIVMHPNEIGKFQCDCLDPVLENICDDYEWWTYCFVMDICPFHFNIRQEKFPNHLNRHYIVPFGIYSPLFEGRGTSLDDYILSNGRDEKGLIRTTELFTELGNE